MNLIDRKLAVFLPLALVVGCASPTDDEEQPTSAAKDGEVVASTADALAAAGCSVDASVPYYSNGRVYTSSWIYCSTRHAKILLNVYLSRDRAIVAQDQATCTNATSCSVSTSAPNISGNQRWCGWGHAVIDSGSTAQVKFDKRGRCAVHVSTPSPATRVPLDSFAETR